MTQPNQPISFAEIDTENQVFAHLATGTDGKTYLLLRNSGSGFNSSIAAVADVDDANQLQALLAAFANETHALIEFAVGPKEDGQ